ncbi:MAG: tetratricopeptide repeat protein, partial [Bacteroidia bacterium]
MKDRSWSGKNKKWLLIVTALLLFTQPNFGNNEHDSLWRQYLNTNLDDSVRYFAFFRAYRSSKLVPGTDSLKILSGNIINKATANYDYFGISIGAFVMAHCFLAETKFDSSYYFEKLALENIRRINAPRVKAGILKSISSLEMQMQNPDSVVSRLNQCEKIYKKLNLKEGLCNTYNLLGIYYYRTGNLTNAFLSYQKALQFQTEIGYYGNASKSATQLAAICDKLNERKLADKFYKKATDLALKSGNPLAIRSVRELQFHEYTKLKKLDEAKKLLEILKNDNFKHTDSIKYHISLGVEGDYYVQSGQPKKALDLYNIVIPYFKSLGIQIVESTGNYAYGSCYLELGDYKKAIEYCEKAYYALRKQKLEENLISSCECLYKAYKNVENHKQSLYYYEIMQRLQDSTNTSGILSNFIQSELRKQSIEDSLGNIQAQLEQELVYEKQIGKEKRNKNIFFGSAVLLV